jgi:hypothetical protein
MNCPIAKDSIRSGIIVQLKPEIILNRTTKGTGRCTAIIQCLENLSALDLKYPKGMLINNTINISSISESIS